jgi:integrase
MPLMGAVAEYLQRLLRQQEEQKAFCGNSWVDNGYIIADKLGRPITFGRLHKNYKRILKVNNLPDIRFHDLRHSVATYLLEIGIPIEEVSACLGHSSIATTAKVYAHVNIGT